MGTGKRFGWIVLAIAAGLVVAAPAGAGKKPKKPDFAVKSVTLLGAAPHYILLDRTAGGLVVNIKVKNQGNATADGDGTLTVQGSGASEPTRFKFEIPKLKPGKTDTVQFDVEGSQLDGITTYTTKACAGAKKDSKQGNDCRTGPGFAAIPRTWTGTTDATWSDGLVIQSLVSTNATFTFNPRATEASGPETIAVFVYDAAGSLTATITGDHDPDCSYSGTGDAAIDPARASLALDTDLLTYRGIGRMPSTTTFTAHATCSDGTAAPHEQEFGTWLDTANVRRNVDDETLTGSQPTPFGDTWNWNLRAE